MATFVYTTIDRTGKRFSGVITAEDISEARAKLRRMDVFVVKMSRAKKINLFQHSKRVKSAELALFTEELGAMLESGVSLVRSLDTLVRQVENSTLRTTIREVQGSLKRGSTFADALAEHPEIFSTFYVSIVKAGENGGILKEMLFKLARYLESEAELLRKVKSALIYPAMVTAVAALAVAFLTIFVVPRFSSVYTKIGSTLPLPTVIMVAVSTVIVKFWWLFLLIGVGGCFALRRYLKTPGGIEKFDMFKMRMPLIGAINRKAISSRFLRVFAALVNSGIPVSDCLDVIQNVFRNTIVVNLVNRLKRSVISGGGISNVLTDSGIFPPVALQMVASGEETGELGKMLEKSADFLEREVEIEVKRMVNTLVPALTVVLTLIVGFIVMAIYLPMFDIMGRISG